MFGLVHHLSRSPIISSFKYGLFCAIVAYGLWGLFPLYFRLLTSVPATEILAYRAATSLLSILPLVVVLGRLREFRRPLTSPRLFGLFLLSTLFITLNWGFYIYVVNIGQTLQASLGYYINPLVNVLLGSCFLKERLRPLQWICVGLATLGVAIFAWEVGQVPYWSFILACSFAGYGFARKFIPSDSVTALAVETTILLPPSLLFLWFCGSFTRFPQWDVDVQLLLLGCGVVTVVPLLFFGGAVRRIPYSTLGICQYLTPTGQFLCAVFVLKEKMLPAQWFCFALIWVALILFSVEAILQSRKTTGT